MNWAWIKKVPKWVWIVGGLLVFGGAVQLFFPEEIARVHQENAEREAAREEARERKRAEKEARRAEKEAKRQERENERAQARAASRETVTVPGQYGWLGTPSGVPSIIVAATKADLDEYIKIASARDQMGLTQLMGDGRVFGVDAGTKVLVIDSTMTTSEVRIQEGPAAGRAAWVPFEYVRASKPN